MTLVDAHTPSALVLDPEQQSAVTAPPGPVCILAGAGSGKTRTVTHRIAYACQEGWVTPEQVLAVTHSQKAAGEMRSRLLEMGLDVSARTFHAAALRMLRHFWSYTGRQGALEILDSRYTLVRRALEAVEKKQIASELVLDVTNEISWARTQMLLPRAYTKAATKAGRSASIPLETVATVFAEYERMKQRINKLDFDDLLQLAAELLEQVPEVAEQFRSAYTFFVVDEYQDTDPLQHRLLRAWLGERSIVTVVGDVNQSVYRFRGAAPDYLLDFEKEFPGAVSVHLEKDYRSSPEVVSLANRLVDASSSLVGMRPSGPRPTVRSLATEPDEEDYVIRAMKRLKAEGLEWKDMAILYRFNSQSARFEAALHTAGIPYNVADQEKFFSRNEVREVLITFGKAARDCPEDVGVEILRTAAEAHGFDRANPPAGAGAVRQRWEAVLALLEMAEAVPGASTLAAEYLLAELQHRAMESHAPSLSSVNLMTIHKAKGLEFPAVFVAALTEGSLPSAYASTPEDYQEEQNLLYVAVTRAEKYLYLTHARARSNGWKSKPSRFLPMLEGPSSPPTATSKRSSFTARSLSASAAPTRTECKECGAALAGSAQKKVGLCIVCLPERDRDLLDSVLAWRSMKATQIRVTPSDLFSDNAAWAILVSRPKDLTSLSRIPGIDAVKRTAWGRELIEHISERL